MAQADTKDTNLKIQKSVYATKKEWERIEGNARKKGKKMSPFMVEQALKK